MSISSMATALRRMLIAEIKKRTRDHFVATITQLMLAASLWGQGLWIHAMTSPARREQVSTVLVEERQARLFDSASRMLDLVLMPAAPQPDAPESPPACYPSGAAATESPHHLATAQRYQF